MSLAAKDYDWKELNQQFEGQTAQDLLGWALKEYSSGVGLASSFGGEDVALLDSEGEVVGILKLENEFEYDKKKRPWRSIEPTRIVTLASGICTSEGTFSLGVG